MGGEHTGVSGWVVSTLWVDGGQSGVGGWWPDLGGWGEAKLDGWVLGWLVAACS